MTTATPEKFSLFIPDGKHYNWAEIDLTDPAQREWLIADQRLTDCAARMGATVTEDWTFVYVPAEHTGDGTKVPQTGGVQGTTMALRSNDHDLI